MLQWLGIDEDSDFDPARFDVIEANRAVLNAHPARRAAPLRPAPA